MAKEIERKFLLINDSWKQYVVKSTRIIQAYLSHRHEGIVRLRIYGDKAFLTIKGKTIGIERHEWEYEIPVKDAMEMLDLKVYENSFIEKTRHIVKYDNEIWEIDEFHGRHQGLILAEIETPYTGYVVKIPPFIGKEVSDDPQYFNSNLNIAY